MAKVIDEPTIIQSAGNKPKLIREYIGRVNSATSEISIAHMSSPAGWKEPGQKPDFDEYTLVLHGLLQVETKDQILQLTAGKAILVARGEWVRYSTPAPGGAEYIAVCLPAFSPETVNRENE